MSDLIVLTDATFEAAVRDGGLPLVVDFWAEWCPPCGPMARTLSELAPEFAGRLRIAKLNADENPETTRAYRVLSMPTLLFFSGRDGRAAGGPGGALTGSLVGLRPKSVLRQALTNALTPYANV
jgi:thioredoxin 1